MSRAVISSYIYHTPFYALLARAAAEILLPSSAVRGLTLSRFTAKALNAGKCVPLLMPLVGMAEGNRIPLSPASRRGRVNC